MNALIHKISQNIVHHEGCVNHMYLDTCGYVTVGVGFLLMNEASAAALPFLNRETRAPATPQEIAQEFQTIKAMAAGKVAQAYKPCTHLILTGEVILQHLNERLTQFYIQLEQKIPDLGDHPMGAQEAIVDMAYNLGTNGLFTKFPNFIASFKDKNWELCAQECTRKGIGDSRNTATAELFKHCQINTESHKHEGH